MNLDFNSRKFFKKTGGHKTKPEQINNVWFCYVRVVILGLVVFPNFLPAQIQDSILPADSLKKLSLEELMNVKVISVSKRPENLNEVASAVQVITQKDIHNSGAKTVTEALRLAPNLQVAQVNSSQWAISARGFNNVLANKLLVLIDGRVVYTPEYAGVYWDVQNLLLEDIERIEVISGPGGTMWGANAVNGVINIITKNSKNTKGLYVEAATGSSMPGLGSIRYGGKITSKLCYRIYGTGFQMGNTLLMDSSNAKDQWAVMQGGLRLDWDATEKDKITLNSTIYNDTPNPDGATAVTARGDNAVMRWEHKSSEKSDFQLQIYYDHTLRDLGNEFKEDLKTYDLDWQNRYRLGKRHNLTYGFDFRKMDDKVTNLELFGFFPANKTLYLYSLFAQDEFILIKNRLRFTLGSKIEHNTYTGLQFQPNGRLTFTPTNKQTIWAAISRAVRNPSRIDRDFNLFLAPGLVYIGGSPNFLSETVLSYELGWRAQIHKKLFTSLSLFYNFYDNIRSAEPGTQLPPLNIPITFGNGVKGTTYGVELTITYQVTSWWNLRGGYNYLQKDLFIKPDSKDLNGASAESNDPVNQFLIQSSMTVARSVELGAVVRYVDKLPQPYVRSYTELDFRIGWKLIKAIELSVVGQDLLNASHTEFIPSSPSPRRIQRSIYGKISCRF